MTDPNGNTVTYGYDAAGNQTSVTDALGHATTYGYNALNGLTSTTDALGHAITYGYDNAGNQTSVTDALNRTTSTTYDVQGRPLTVTDPNGGITSYTYDLAGNQTSITDSVGNTTSYTYNAANLLTTMTDPLGHSTTYAYDAANQLISTTDREGRTTTFGYDQAGRETSETWVGGNYTATYAYNQAGQLTWAQDPNSSYTYTYDTAGDVTSVDNAGTPGVPHVLLSYGYDSFGNRTSMTDSLGGRISYGYDSDNQLTSMALSTSMTRDAQVTFGYNQASRLTGITRTGASGSDTIASSFSYDNADRLTNITHTDRSKSTTLANYTYGYDAASQLTSYQDANSSLTYGYDNSGELTSATGTLNGSSYGVSYSYDKNGNRNMTGYTTGTGNELTSDGAYNYTYDNEGNTLTQTQIATGTRDILHLGLSQSLDGGASQGDQRGTVLNDEKFTYDVNDNRIGVMLNGAQQLYTVYDGSNPYIDFNGSGTLTQRYLTDPRGLNQFYGQVSASGTTQWFLTDNINSIRQVVDSSGNSLDAITYDPYGIIVSQTNAANAPRMGYTGGAFDSLTGAILDGGRQETPANGRFRNQDSWGLVPGPNPYEYVGNSPVDALDPTGHDMQVSPIKPGGLPLGISQIIGYLVIDPTGTHYYQQIPARLGNWPIIIYPIIEYTSPTGNVELDKALGLVPIPGYICLMRNGGPSVTLGKPVAVGAKPPFEWLPPVTIPIVPGYPSQIPPKKTGEEPGRPIGAPNPGALPPNMLPEPVFKGFGGGVITPGVYYFPGSDLPKEGGPGLGIGIGINPGKKKKP